MRDPPVAGECQLARDDLLSCMLASLCGVVADGTSLALVPDYCTVPIRVSDGAAKLLGCGHTSISHEVEATREHMYT